MSDIKDHSNDGNKVTLCHNDNNPISGFGGVAIPTSYILVTVKKSTVSG
jgi:hypothetical protein